MAALTRCLHIRMAEAWIFTGCILHAVVPAVTILKVAGRSRQQPISATELTALHALDAIYNGQASSESENNTHAQRAHREVYNNTGDGAASVYGEIQPDAVLEMFRVTGMKEGQRYYDLGSGYGKTVVLAWLVGLNATGVELATNRWQASCAALRRAPEVGVSGSGNGVNFLHASFLNVDFLDADLVFLDSVMFSDETLQGIARLARHLKPGAKIVSSHMGLPGPGFNDVGELKGSVSWTHRKSRWTIQTVATPGSAAGLPDASDIVNKRVERSNICTL